MCLFRLAENIIRTRKASPAFRVIGLFGKPGGKAFYHAANHRLSIFRRHRLGGGDVLFGRPSGGPGPRSKFAWRDFSETRRHDFAPRRVGRGICEQRLQGALRRRGVPTLQGGLGAIIAGPRIIARFCKFGFGGWGNCTLRGQHQGFTQFGMQPGFVGLQGNRAGIRVLRFGEASQGCQGAPKQSPALTQIAISLQPGLELI